MLLPSWLVERATAVRLPLAEGESGESAPVGPEEPTTEEEIRQELRIALDDEAARITLNAIAAREWIERKYGLALIAGTHRCTVPVKANGRLDLPVHPVLAVDSVRRRQADGDLEDLDDDDWWEDLDYRPARVWVKATCGVYVVTCQTGWTPETVPQAIKEAIAYRVWGNVDSVATEDWQRAVDVRVRPFAVKGLL